MSKSQKITKEQYLKGNPKFNLLLNERRLILSAIIKSKWKLKDAYKLNYPNQDYCLTSYGRKVVNHHINVRDRTYLMLSEIK